MRFSLAFPLKHPQKVAEPQQTTDAFRSIPSILASCGSQTQQRGGGSAVAHAVDVEEAGL